MKAKQTAGSGRLLAVGVPVVGLVVAAAVLGLRAARRGPGEDEAAFLSSEPTRTLEARLSHPGADRYRPYHAVSRGQGASPTGASLEVLARLEAQGDMRGLASAYLLSGAPELAASYLERAGSSPEVLNDQAVLALAKGDATGALSRLDRAFQERPGSAQALWNRGLALRELELWALAAESFEAVATRGEPGWADEARSRAQALRERVRAEQQSWNEASAAGKALVLGQGSVTSEQLRARPDVFRLYLYDAIRAAPSEQTLRALWPLAETLDAHFGGSALRDAIRWAERRDFQRRAPLAALYAHYFQQKSVPGGLAAYLEQLRAAGERDLLMGVLVLSGEVEKDVEGYARLAAETRDPWFHLIAENERARAAIGRGALFQAEQLLLAATSQCSGGTLAYRCGLLLERLSTLYRRLWRLPEAARSVKQARALYLRGGFWGPGTHILQHLGQIARLQGQGVLARALLDEVLARYPEDCAMRRFVRANDALSFLEELRLDEARASLDDTLKCQDLPLLSEMMTVAELARLRPELARDQRVMERLQSHRASNKLDPGQRALLSHIEGRFLIEQDRSRGEQMLRQAIAEAEQAPRASVDAREARAYSYASLLFAAGKAGEWSRALALFGEEVGGALPSRCLLAVTVDRERTLALALGPDGRMEASYDAGRRKPLGEEVRGVVPAALAEPLRGCEQVSVLARPPLHGRAGVLPDDIAWRYLVLPGTRLPSGEVQPLHLVVKDVESPAALGLPRLGAWEPAGANATVLSGSVATPSRVLEAMSRATEIEIHAHGLINPTLSDASLLVLTPDASGRYALTAGEVRTHRLEGHPLVTLAACRAAHTGVQVHEPFSLPTAFIEAGARTVLAATVDIPDAEAGPFFLEVQERIRTGQAAAVALRDVRMEWLSRAPDSWVRSVLVFE
ncbi:CHAT domain-containing protein [Hyalangium gracile]|uniref:CHAT domain-containing protein n=1 Tax=Hyalangium gracile TaxID=394092 RepID=UPI001CCA7DE2|nr:CHAT domain-containing protein [Hyalangium gracile]